jgi:hypothetical protein
MEHAEQPSSFPPAIIQQTDKADLLDKIKPDQIVEVLKHRLMGEEEVDGQWIKVPSLKEYAISETGAWQISNLMLAVSSQNVALSNLTDDEIRHRTRRIVDATMLLMIKNWKEFGITGKDQFQYIKEIVYSNTFVTLKQPEHAGIRGLIKGTTTEVRQVAEHHKPKSNWLNLFKPR